MHELGHAMGIILDEEGHEAYCSDTERVMVMLGDENAGLYLTWPCAPYDSGAIRPGTAAYYLAWHYCPEHWATKNLGYYRAGEAALSSAALRLVELDQHGDSAAWLNAVVLREAELPA